jgi:hypothetical protein
MILLCEFIGYAGDCFQFTARRELLYVKNDLEEARRECIGKRNVLCQLPLYSNRPTLHDLVCINKDLKCNEHSEDKFQALLKQMLTEIEFLLKDLNVVRNNGVAADGESKVWFLSSRHNSSLLQPLDRDEQECPPESKDKNQENADGGEEGEEPQQQIKQPKKAEEKGKHKQTEGKECKMLRLQRLYDEEEDQRCKRRKQNFMFNSTPKSDQEWAKHNEVLIARAIKNDGGM